MLTGEGYGPAADTWSCGVILYCLLSATYPFIGESASEVFDALATHRALDFTSPLWRSHSPAVIDLLQRLLTKDPGRRISLQDVLSHPWMATGPAGGTSPLVSLASSGPLAASGSLASGSLASGPLAASGPGPYPGAGAFGGPLSIPAGAGTAGASPSQAEPTAPFFPFLAEAGSRTAAAAAAIAGRAACPEALARSSSAPAAGFVEGSAIGSAGGGPSRSGAYPVAPHVPPLRRPPSFERTVSISPRSPALAVDRPSGGAIEAERPRGGSRPGPHATVAATLGAAPPSAEELLLRARLHGFVELFRAALEAPYTRLLAAPDADAAAREWDACCTGLRSLDAYLRQHAPASTTTGTCTDAAPLFLGEAPSLAEAFTAPVLFRMVANMAAVRDLELTSACRELGLSRLAAWILGVLSRAAECCEVAALSPEERAAQLAAAHAALDDDVDD